MSHHHHGHEHHEECHQDLSEEPIRLPGSPFWNVFKRFGRDEMIALVINTVGTTIIGLFAVPLALLAFVGPVIEKIGFFPAHIKEAVELYRSTPKNHRRSLWSYLKKAMKNGSVSLFEDLLIHDPLYILLFVALSIYPGIPVWLIAAVSFIAAIIAVSWLEVTWHEIRYRLFQWKLKRAGFGKDSYFEARFFLHSDGEETKELVEKLREGLKLSEPKELEYRDTYFTNHFPKFSGRVPILRLRERTLGNCDAQTVSKKNQTVQIVYARAQEEQEKKVDQFRFFLISKEKFYYRLSATMPQTIGEIRNSKIETLLKAGKEHKRVVFRRTLMRDESKKLLVTVDAPTNENHHCVIEIKARDNPNLLISAMRFVMTEFPATQTTMPKSELSFFE